MPKSKLLKILLFTSASLAILIYPSAMNLYNSNRLDSVITDLSSPEMYPGVDAVVSTPRTSCSATGNAKNLGPKAQTCLADFDVVSRAAQDPDGSVEEIRAMYEELTQDSWYPRANDTSDFSDEFEHRLVPQRYYTELNKEYGAVSCDIEGRYEADKQEFMFEISCHYNEKLFGLSFR